MIKVKGFVVKEEEFKGNQIKVLYMVLEDDSLYRVGTLKNGKTFNFVNCMHREFKQN